jgi:hypothetical protein
LLEKRRKKKDILKVQKGTVIVVKMNDLNASGLNLIKLSGAYLGA